jgi:2-polyprenyl-6-methoxyphenol hydroxylase-like FAD-dependent oxidoreductase
VIVVGAGLAGTTTAALLGRQGITVTLVDMRAVCPPVFKAEKVEPDQIEQLRRFDLPPPLLPRAKRIRAIHSYYGSRLFDVKPIEQYGISYSDLVGDLRARLPESVRFRQGRVVAVANGPDVQLVRLADGEELRARLVVLACGLNAEIPASLGFRRIWVSKPQSVALAFSITPKEKERFRFDSATCYPTSTAMGIDYITLFPMGEAMRANLFAFPAGDDAWVREFVQRPGEGLRKCFPGLQRAIGKHEVAGAVETSLINLYKTNGLYRTNGASPDGVVLIGDASQNACPSTGSGVTKVLTDVDLLCRECLPRWLATSGMGNAKLAEFYANSRKRAVDEQSLADAIYRRTARTNKSLRWKIHRIRVAMPMCFGRPSEDRSLRM